jgi:hypothetical protein
MTKDITSSDLDVSFLYKIYWMLKDVVSFVQNELLFSHSLNFKEFDRGYYYRCFTTLTSMMAIVF